MYLKEIIINGFKSFADRTCLDLQRGVTAVVGPNGCGKSNIVDAIRWVQYGEVQKAQTQLEAFATASGNHEITGAHFQQTAAIVRVVTGKLGDSSLLREGELLAGLLEARR